MGTLVLLAACSGPCRGFDTLGQEFNLRHATAGVRDTLPPRMHVCTGCNAATFAALESCRRCLEAVCVADLERDQGVLQGAADYLGLKTQPHATCTCMPSIQIVVLEVST